MRESANQLTPEWAADTFGVYVPPEPPWGKRSAGPRTWEDLISNEDYFGVWETLDPFPARLGVMWDELLTRHAPQLFQRANPVLLEKLRMDWAKQFSSALIRVQISEYHPLDRWLQPEGPIPSDSHFLGMGQVARIEYWRRGTCGHRVHPQAGCTNSLREVIPIPPRCDMNYWFATVEDGDYRFHAVLETPLRTDLGAKGPVYVCRSQQILEWYLPQAARILDPYWHLLPTMIAKSQLDDRFFRANRTKK